MVRHGLKRLRDATGTPQRRGRRLLIGCSAILALLLSISAPLPAAATAGTIDAKKPAANESLCHVTVDAPATFKPTTAGTSAILSLKAPDGDFVSVLQSGAGPGGTVTANFNFDVGINGTYALYVDWQGAGLAYVNQTVRSPTSTFSVSDCDDFPPQPPPPPPHADPPSLSPGVKDSIEAAEDVAIPGAVIACGAAVVGGVVIVLSEGTVAPLLVKGTEVAASACAGLLLTVIAAEWKLHHDPPDGKYAEVPLVEPMPLPSYQTCPNPVPKHQCPNLEQAVRHYQDISNRVANLWVSSYVESNRWNTAKSDDNEDGMALQAASDRVFDGELAAAYAEIVPAGRAMIDALAKAGLHTGPFDTSRIAKEVPGADLESQIPAAMTPYLKTLNTDQINAADLLKTQFVDLVKNGVTTPDLYAAWAPAVDTSGLLEAYHGLTPDDVAALVEALVHQHKITDYRGNLLNDDLRAYSDNHCVDNFLADANAINDPQVSAFLTTAAQGLAQVCSGPVVVSTTPNQGPVSGGTKITLHGRNLQDANGVDFDGVAGSDLSCTPTSCTVTTPPGQRVPTTPPASYDVSVYVGTTSGSSSYATASTRFAYYPTTAAGPVTLPSGTAIKDGGFEPPATRAVPSGYVVAEPPDNSQLLGSNWTIQKGAIDIVGPDVAGQIPAEGNQFVDLNGNADDPSPATISQHMSTTPGHRYQLNFRLAANPNGSPQDPPLKTMTATLGKATKDFSIHVSEDPNAALEWAPKSLATTPCTGSVDLDFTSTTQGFRGPMVDAVSVVDLGPDPAEPCTAHTPPPPHTTPPPQQGGSGGGSSEHSVWYLLGALLLITMIAGGVVVSRRHQ